MSSPGGSGEVEESLEGGGLPLSSRVPFGEPAGEESFGLRLSNPIVRAPPPPPPPPPPLSLSPLPPPRLLLLSPSCSLSLSLSLLSPSLPLSPSLSLSLSSLSSLSTLSLSLLSLRLFPVILPRHSVREFSFLSLPFLFHSPARPVFSLSVGSLGFPSGWGWGGGAVPPSLVPSSSSILLLVYVGE